MKSVDEYPAERLAAPGGAWQGCYAELAAQLRQALGSAWLVEHVGSTSIPGLPAKPVIDLAVCPPDDCPIADAGLLLVRAGWTQPVVVGDHKATLLMTCNVRSAIAHIFTAEQWPVAHVRLFADWLRTHPVDRDRYAALKVNLVAQGVWGRDYTSAKAGFVLEIVNQARRAQGLSNLAGLS